MAANFLTRPVLLWKTQSRTGNSAILSTLILKFRNCLNPDRDDVITLPRIFICVYSQIVAFGDLLRGRRQIPSLPQLASVRSNFEVMTLQIPFELVFYLSKLSDPYFSENGL